MVSSAKEHIYMNLQGQGEPQSELQPGPRRHASEDGYAMAALLVTIAIMAVLMTVAMPTWRQQQKREKEAELIWRAGQYVHAVELYKRKFANAYPTSIDTLVKGRFLRKKYLDPMTKNGEFRLISPQELQGVPTGLRNFPGGPDPTNQAGFGARRQGNAGTSDNRPGSGTAMTGSGLTTSGGPGTTPGAPGTIGGFGSSDPNQPGSSSGPGGTLQVGPIASVASRSTDQSIRIFKGRDHYNQWIVTIEDVVPRQFLRQQQPTQPGQAPGQNPGGNPGRPSSPTTPNSPIR